MARHWGVAMGACGRGRQDESSVQLMWASGGSFLVPDSDVAEPLLGLLGVFLGCEWMAGKGIP